MAALEKVVIDTVTFGMSHGGSGFADVLNSWVLWRGPDVRGSDRLIAHLDGARPKRRRATVSSRTLELLISGEKDHLGVPHDDPRVGLELNIMHIRDNVADPLDTDEGTRTCSVYLPSGSVLSGPVHIEAFDFAESGLHDVRATFDLTLPEGSLVEGS